MIWDHHTRLKTMAIHLDDLKDAKDDVLIVPVYWRGKSRGRKLTLVARLAQVRSAKLPPSPLADIVVFSRTMLTPLRSCSRA
jgi:hypothetical protein